MRNTTNRIEPVLFWSRTGLNRFWFGNLRNRIEPVSDSIGTGLVKSRIESNRNMPDSCNGIGGVFRLVTQSKVP